MLVNNIHIYDLKTLDGYKKLKEEEASLINTLNWFNTEGDEWGIVEMMITGVHAYLSEIESSTERIQISKRYDEIGIVEGKI